MSAASDQPQSGFMHERSRLKRLPWGFVGEFVCGQSAQFIIDNRQQFLSGLGFPLLNAVQNTYAPAMLTSLRRLCKARSEAPGCGASGHSPQTGGPEAARTCTLEACATERIARR